MKAHGVSDEGRPAGGRRRLLAVDEVAAHLGVSRKTDYRLTHRGELVPSRVGERLRFRPDEIDEYLERNRVGAAP
jgi:excisionase family DNA binding protein